MPQVSNPYCDKLGIPAPSVDDLALRERVKIFHLMVAALLEHGGPMTLGEIADRLSGAGTYPPSGDIELSIKKAWHGMEPVYRDDERQFHLNLGSMKLKQILWNLEPKQPAASPQPISEPPRKPDTEPLTIEELDAAMRGRSLYAYSQLRMAAAVLDAHVRSMSLSEVVRILSRLGVQPNRIEESTARSWTSDLIRKEVGGRMTLNLDSPDLPSMRRAIRSLAHPVLAQRARDEKVKQFIARREQVETEERDRRLSAPDSLRRAILRAVPDPDDPQAMAVLDLKSREIRFLAPGEMHTVGKLLTEYDLLAGIEIRDTVHALGLDPLRWKLVDLKVPQKTWRLNRRGRVLRLTPELLISGTTGMSRPLGEPAKIAEYLRRGDWKKLARRLESDLKALCAFYRYGVLQGCVRLQWGFLDELLLVEWAAPGEPGLYDYLKHAMAAGRPIDVVLRWAPSWSDPWGRARRVTVAAVEYSTVRFLENGIELPVSRYDIQAVRIVEEQDASSRDTRRPNSVTGWNAAARGLD